MGALPLEKEIEYPTSDGQPMAETPEHLQVMFDLIDGLKRRYAAVMDVWAGGNLFFCYERGNRRACVAPDVMLAKGVEKWDRPNYLLWVEGAPSLIVEVTSRKTQRKDQRVKKPLYERLGVEEFFLFDPFEEYLQPQLQGYRQAWGRYQPIVADADGSVLSRTTGLRFKPEGKRLRMVDAVTGEPLLWSEELEAARLKEAAARRAAEARAAKETAARQTAETRAVKEAAARQAAETRAAEETAARREAEERLRALEKELERLRKG